MRRFLTWSGAGLLLLLAGVLVDASRAAPARLRPPSPVLGVGVGPPGSPLRAAMVLQKADCSGNLRTLELLHRGAVREQLALATIWFAGPASDSTTIRSLLPSWTGRVPLRPVPNDVLAQLKALGHHSTPVLLIFDQEGRVRLTTQTPRSPREYAGLRRAIEGLTWIEEL
jgi:hypothetical protein